MFDLLTYALKHSKTIDRIMQQQDLGLRRFELEERVWVLLKQLCNILKVSLQTVSCHPRSHMIIPPNQSLTHILQILKNTTMFFSHSTPNLAMVIPAMDHIDIILTTNSLNKQYTLLIHVVLRMAKKTLNQHYQLTDDWELYYIAMGTYSTLFYYCTCEHDSSASSSQIELF